MRAFIPMLSNRRRRWSARVPALISAVAERCSASARRWRAGMPAAVLLFQAAILGADPVSETQVRLMAEGWLRAGHAVAPYPAGTAVGEVQPIAGLGFAVYLQPAGLVIVPADDRLEPILAFAARGRFEHAADHPLSAMVLADLQARLGRLAAGKTSAVDTLARQKWRYLTGLAAVPADNRALTPNIADQRVPPLLSTAWDQKMDGYQLCYNYFTPNHYPCGCVATAMAQLMRYHRYPAAAVGPRHFEVVVEHDPNPYQTLTILGGDGAGGPYNWDMMPVDPDENTTLAQRQSIGALCLDAGISVNMRYGPMGSGADFYTAMQSLKNVFYFSNIVYGWNNFEFIGIGLLDMVNPNLDAGRPVLFSVSGPGGQHAIVCDGYGYDLGAMYHHLNLGWGAYDDVNNAWYALPFIDAALEFDCVDVCLYNIFTGGGGEIISGRLTDEYGHPIAGALVSAECHGGGSWQVYSNRRGIYAFAGVPANAGFTILPAKSGYVFGMRTVQTGASADYRNVSGNQAGVDFIGAGPPAPPAQYPLLGDYAGIGRAALALYRVETSAWSLRLAGGVSNFNFGVPDCQPVLADFDGDGRADPGLYHDGANLWGVNLSGSGYATTYASFGYPGAQPAAADFDGDGLADPALFIAGEGRWLALFSGQNYALYDAVLGGSGGAPVAADFDDDGRGDPGVYQYAGTWSVMLSSQHYQPAALPLGGPEYSPAAGDYDGDGRADPAVFRPADGRWRIMQSGSAYALVELTFAGN